jgi:hypothetical protein
LGPHESAAFGTHVDQAERAQPPEQAAPESPVRAVRFHDPRGGNVSLRIVLASNVAEMAGNRADVSLPALSSM